ncbi:MAG TPA: DUF4242 domain-containing protein [Chitinophagaceae bacterium]
MKKFIVERTLPVSGELPPEELQAFSHVSCHAIDLLDWPYHWIQSFVTDDKIYCIHIAESEELIREHAMLGNLPISSITEVKATLDPSSGKHS